jgi:hypothetical protein
MNLPSAIREDHNPFGVLGLFPGYQRLLIFLRWTSYGCPHCSHIFRRDFWPANVRLGAGKHVCKKCGKVFNDCSREWPALIWSKKLRYFLPPGVQAVIGGGLFCAIFTLFIAPKDVVNWATGIMLFAFFLSPALLWSLLRSVFVVRSIRRFSGNSDGSMYSEFS